MFRTFSHPGSRLKVAFRNVAYRVVATARRSLRSRQLRHCVYNALSTRADHALFSLICPLRQAPLRHVSATIESLVRQPYPHWELVLVGAPARADSLRDRMGRSGAALPVRVIETTEQMTIADQLNLGIETARGPWCAFIEAGDRLTIDALPWLWWQQVQKRHLRWMYTDESHSLHVGRSYNHKPDFSPELLLSQMFTGNLAAFHRETVISIGGLRPAFAEACLYDLCLRLSERLPSAVIAHIPYALFHRGTGTKTLTGTVRSAPEDGRAVTAALDRRKVRAAVTQGNHRDRYPRIRFVPARRPEVTVVIPTRNAAELLIPCIRSLRRQTQYENYRILVIDNQSEDPALLKYLAEERARDRLDVFRYDHPFNHSEMHNRALATVKSEFVVLLNNDVDSFSEGWLEELVGTAELSRDIAGVGARLVFPDGTIQHGGILLGLRGWVAHSHVGHPRDSAGYFGRLVSLQECSGATAALLLLRTDAFWSVSGFDAEAFPTSYNDVDLCLRMRRAGYRCIYNPSVTARHCEGSSRSPAPDEAEFRHRLAARWGAALQGDPFYSVSLSRRCEFVKDFGVDSQQLLLSELTCRFEPRSEDGQVFPHSDVLSVRASNIGLGSLRQTP